MDPQCQFIDHKGDLDDEVLEKFVGEAGLSAAARAYMIISIIGPQSSGKSTLLNHMFGTRFREMDALSGRGQTTQGVWAAKSHTAKIPTLILDIEGSDSRERGEDDTAFEKKTALLALAVSDVVLVNMWSHDIGREQGSGKPLLRTVLQVNLKLFRPEATGKGAGSGGRTRLMFVLRDRTRTPLDMLRATLMEDLGKMWEGLAKPAGYELVGISTSPAPPSPLPLTPPQGSSLEDFFETDFVALPSFEHQPDDFKREAGQLSSQFEAYAEASVVPQFNPEGGPGSGHKVPSTALGLHVSKAWEVIRQDKDLNLPAQRVLVSTIRCEEIAASWRARVAHESEAWGALAAEGKEGLVADFKARASAIFTEAGEGYDGESQYFDLTVRAAKRDGLMKDLALDLAPTVRAQAKFLADKYTKRFSDDAADVVERSKKGGRPRASSSSTASFSQGGSGAGADPLAAFKPVPLAQFAQDHLVERVESFSREAHDSLLVDPSSHELSDILDEASTGLKARLEAHVARLRDEVARVQTEGTRAATVRQLLAPQVAAYLDRAETAATWKGIRSTTADAAARASRALRDALSSLGLPRDEVSAAAAALMDAATGAVRTQCEEAAAAAQTRMRDRFFDKFNYNDKGLPRTWGPKSDVAAAARDAKVAAAEVLACYAVMRWSDLPGPGPAGSSGAAGPSGSAPAPPTDAVQRSLYLMADPSATSDRALDALSAGSVCDVSTAIEWPADLLRGELGVTEASDVLLQPPACRRVWSAFSSEVHVVVLQAQAAQEAAAQASRQRSLPLWVYALMVILGWNELMAVLGSPIKLALVIVLGMFVVTLYSELDVDGEMQRGLLPGSIALAGKLRPALQNVSGRMLDATLDAMRGAAEKGLKELDDSGLVPEGLRPALSASNLPPRAARRELEMTDARGRGSEGGQPGPRNATKKDD